MDAGLFGPAPPGPCWFLRNVSGLFDRTHLDPAGFYEMYRVCLARPRLDPCLKGGPNFSNRSNERSEGSGYGYEACLRRLGRSHRGLRVGSPRVDAPGRVWAADPMKK